MNAQEYFVSNSEIQIGGGKYIDILDPDMNKINIYDISHALSNTGRFGGHSKYFYSVAQHCVLGSLKASDNLVAWDFLMHDACEAFIMDVPSPLKYNLRDYLTLEKIWEPLMCTKFDVLYPFDHEVKRLDLEALCTERRDLLHPNGTWGILKYVSPWEEPIVCWHPIYANYRFLKQAKEIGIVSVRVPNKIIPCMIQGVQYLFHKLLTSLEK